MFDSIFRTGVSFIILMVISTWIGKQVNSHNNHYNFALSITIGSFIANMSFHTTLHFTPMLMSFFTLILLYLLASIISSRSRKLRLWFSGEPTVVIQDGKILDSNMKKIRYSLDDLNQQLREQGIFNFSEVDYALLEVSGKLSVMKKPQHLALTKQDFYQRRIEQENLPLEIIMDGKTVEKNFNSQYTKSWLEQELSERKLKMEDIFYAVISSNGALIIDVYDDNIKSPLDKE
ncbi:DUF421 domain-containing protein [Neobacillus terrae]|uniref:DUF421 domain-containing protein n=1 Tax=Neobacillus terrae TaxID=3034837 RepID=UPI0030835508